MGLDLNQALTLPYREAYRKNLVLYGGLAAIASFVLTIGAMLVIGVPLALVGAVLEALGLFGSSLLAQILLQGLQVLVQGVASAYMLGYLWRLIAHFQNPTEHPQPQWTKDPVGLLKDGLKAYLYTILLSMLAGVVFVVLAVCSVVVTGVSFWSSLQELQHLDSNSPDAQTLIWPLIGALLSLFGAMFLAWAAGYIFLGPFLFAPLIRSAQTRTLSELFNLSPAWQLAARHYDRGILAMLATVGVGILYTVGFFFSLLTVIGWIFLIFPSYVSMAHLINQALWEQTNTELKQESSQ